MSTYTSLLGSSMTRKKPGAKWAQRFVPESVVVTEGGIRAVTIDEGGSVSFTLQVLNYRVGSRMILWMTNNAPGTSGSGLVPDVHWLKSWYTVMRDILVANGFDVVKLTSNTTPQLLGQMSLMATVKAGYYGQVLTFTNTVRKNRTTEKSQPRYAQLLLQTKVAASDPDFTNIQAPTNILRVRDTSQSPAGAPTLSMRNFDVDGVSAAKGTLYPGDGMTLRLDTENMLSGTKVRLYIANDGQKKFTPQFRTGLINRLKEGLVGIDYEFSKPAPSTDVFYQGATVIFTDDYTDANPFSFTFYAGDQITEADGTMQFDIIALITKEGTANDFDTVTERGDYNNGSTYYNGDIVTYVSDGGKYILDGASTRGVAPPADPWRLYIPTRVLRGSFSGFVKARPPRVWEVRAVTDRVTITYAFHAPKALESGGPRQVTMISTNEAPGFQNALLSAADITAALVGDDGTTRTYRLTAAADAQEMSFRVPHGGAGKHRLALADPSADQFVSIADACVYLSAIVKPIDPRFTVGVNLSGAEASGGAGTVPGIFSRNYVYPSRPDYPEGDPRRHQYMDYMKSLGIRVIRLPVKWERIQRELYSPLTGEKPAGVPFDSSTPYDIARVDEIINYWTADGSKLILDIHNYCSYAGQGVRLSYDDTFKTTALWQLWEMLGNRYASNTNVWFGLMNEPSGQYQTAQRVAEMMQGCVNAIRSRTPALNKILVPGNKFCSAQEWVSSGQAEAYDSFYDPADNFAFEAHSYFDSDASGNSGICISGTQSRLVAITQWAKLRGFKLFLGECAGGDPTVQGQQACGTVLPAIYKYMTDNQDAWLGWTTWSSGPYWGPTYAFTLNPSDLIGKTGHSGAMKMLIPFIQTIP